MVFKTLRKLPTNMSLRTYFNL